MQPLAGLLVVDLTRYLPGPYASRELMRLGARVTRLLAPGGDPMQELAPAWHEALNDGKETVEIDLKAEPDRGRALCAEADVVLESFRPGVIERLGIGPVQLPERVVYCSFTGFGARDQTAGHDLNYQGWAGLLADTAPTVPAVQIADLGAAQRAVAEVLAALLQRERTGRGAHLVVSLTHAAHGLASHRLGGEPFPRLLTGGLACYRIYATADGRHLTVAALEPKFFRRLCELIGRPELAGRQWDAEQELLAADLAEIFAARTLETWSELFEGEDVSVGPVATLEEAAVHLRASPSAAGSASKSGSRPGTSG